jgi:hypothetical protein
MAYDNSAGIIAASVILEVLTLACVALRLYTRWWKPSRVLTSDWIILAAFVCGSGLTVMQIYGRIFYALLEDYTNDEENRGRNQSSCSPS